MNDKDQKKNSYETKEEKWTSNTFLILDFEM